METELKGIHGTRQFEARSNRPGFGSVETSTLQMMEIISGPTYSALDVVLGRVVVSPVSSGVRAETIPAKC